MNQSQLKYIRERAAKVKREKEAAITSKYAVQSFTKKQKHAALLAGEFVVNKRLPYGADYYLSTFITFPGEPQRDTKGEAREKAQLERDYQKLMDNIILGEAPKALALLEAFAQSAGK